MTNKKRKDIYLREAGKIALPFPLRILYWFKIKKDIKKEKRIIKYNTEKKIASTYKQFNYYCPHCLFQTNDFTKICPECRSSKLLKTN